MICLCILLLAGCASGEKQDTESGEAAQESVSEEEIPVETKDFFAMDTYMSVTAYGTNAEKAVEQAQARVEELDDMLSVGKEDSEVSKLNAASKAKLSDDAFYLMKRSLEICKETDGAFNPAIYPLMELWGFPTGEYKVPEKKERRKLLKNMNPEDITLNEATQEVTFEKDGMKVDFGGIAKGYTSAEIMNIFKENGVESGMVSLGGNVQVLGTKTDGSLWRIAVQNPDSEGGYLGVLEARDKAVITSGGYERYFEQDGNIYHHILDPSTGEPAENGLTSVTIVSEDGVMADGLSTALFVMGPEKAKEFWRNHKDDFDVILFTEDEKLLVSEGLEDSFETDYEMEVIH
jgi:thiamine biosynthesis lipoprotein